MDNIGWESENIDVIIIFSEQNTIIVEFQPNEFILVALVIVRKHLSYSSNYNS